MVATKDVHATMAGVSMLESGGNAVDAAVAACFAVGVVEPASSGIGGGGYLVYQVGDRGGVVGFPMKGPLAATPDMYELTGEAAVGNFGWAGVVNDENLEGYRSIAVPGAVAGLCEAHRRLGKLPLSEVLAPAVSLAREGHSPGWHNIYSLGLMAGKLFLHEELRRVFMPGGSLPAGDLTSLANFRQPKLADVLETIGRDGPESFYTGDIARALVSDIQDNGGMLSERDLAEYAPFVWDGGLEFSYSGHTVRVPPFACAGTTSAMTLLMADAAGVRDRWITTPLKPCTGTSGPPGWHTPTGSNTCPTPLSWTFRGRDWSRMGYTHVCGGSLYRRINSAEVEPGDPWAFEDRPSRRRYSKPAPRPSTPAPPTCARWTGTVTPSRSRTRSWPDSAPVSSRRARGSS